MPNHCKNELTIWSDKEDIEKLVEHLKGPKSMFDFNSLVPMPEEIEDTNSVTTGNQKYYYSQKKWLQDRKTAKDTTKGKDVAVYILDFPPTEWVKENCHDVFTLRRLERESGAVYWYDWACKRWGTKWNAYDVEYCISPVKTLTLGKSSVLFANVPDPQQIVYTMLTAWMEPRPIFTALRDYLTPPEFSEYLSFEWRFQDEEEHFNGTLTEDDEV